jgi:serine/threonine protein kinase/N-acetylneuraminic acid mutarotase
MDDVDERLTRLDPGTVFAGYRIEGMLDRGGMGVVYRATDEDLNRTVALKIIAPEHTQNPDAVTRFKSEARLAASLEHPNIVPIHRGGEYRGVLYLAMRFVPGTNLRHIIDKGPMPIDRVQRIVTAVASALDTAHERGLVHRDVKPANILISGEGDHEHVYLTDFGLTKRLGSAGSLTRTGAWVGTPDYVAPEQIKAGPVDGRADIYSLGCVLYEMLAGEVAYPKDNDMAKLWAHVQDPCPMPSEKRPELVKAFDDVVARATAKEPEDRFAHASELAAAVSAAAEQQRSHLGGAGIQATRAAGIDAPSFDEHDVFIAEPTRLASAPPKDPTPPPPGTEAPDFFPPQPQPLAGTAPPVVPETPAPAAAPPSPPATPPPSGPAAAVPPGPRPTPPQRGRSRLLIALGLIGVLVVAAAVVLLAGGGDNESSTPPPPVPAATKLPADLEWQPVADLPFQRQYAASTVVKGKVYVFGGIGNRTSSTTTKIYDPASNRWSTGPGLPVPLHHFAAVTYKGQPVVIGGFVPGDELTSGQSRDVYVLREGTWQKLPSLHYPRAAAAAAVVGNKIVVAGGQAGGKLVPQTEVFDGERWSDAADIPTPREHIGGASDGRYFYAVGGRELSAAKNSGALERYDPAKNSWSELEGMPKPVGGISAAYAGGRIVAVGGEGTTSAFDYVQGYDIRGRKWDELPALSSPRHGVATAVIKDVLYAIGGATEAGHVGATRQSELLDLSGRDGAPVVANAKWRAVTDAPTKVQYTASAEVGGRVWIFGGIGADETATAETYAYDRAINTWTPGPRLPRPLHHAAAVTFKGEAVVIGGFLPGGGLTSAVSDRVYALRGDRWVQLPPLLHKRAAAAAAVVGGKIVVVGGQADGKLVPQTEVFDGQRWTEAAEIPTPREHLGAASDGRYVYAVGGRELSAAKNSGALERYDPANDSWTTLDAMPKVVGAVSVAYLAGRVVAVGGEGVTTVSGAVQAYDVNRQAWSQLPALPKPRHGSAVAALGGSLYSIGGAAAAGHVQSTQDVYVLDLE